MSKKVWLITGAGRGMGIDFARAALTSDASGAIDDNRLVEAVPAD